jgi:hypothetical protein
MKKLLKGRFLVARFRFTLNSLRNCSVFHWELNNLLGQNSSECFDSRLLLWMNSESVKERERFDYGIEISIIVWFADPQCT